MEWILRSPTDDFWSTAAVLLALTVAGFLGSFYFFYRKRVIEDTPTSRIRSAAQGYVELSGSGTLMEGPPIIAPLTGTTCTWYGYKVEEHRRSGKNSKWVTIDSGDSSELFLLVDDTGKCIIDPEGAGVTTAGKDVWYGSSSRPQTRPARNRSLLTSLAGGKYRYTERRMHPGEPLYAIGLFKTVGGAGGDFNTDADVRDLIKEWKHNSDALLEKFDTNKDGQIDMVEWQAVREAAYREVTARLRENQEAPPANVMSKTLDRRRPYILSAIPQEFLIRRFYRYALGLLLLFFVCGSLGTWMISVRLGGG